LSEFDSYPHFEKYLQEKDYKTFTRIKMPKMNNIEFDVVGIRKHKTQNKYYLASIEVKETDVSRVIEQAYVRQIMFDYCYIGFPINGGFSYVLHCIAGNFKFLKEKKIGILIWDDLRKKMYTPLDARMSDHIQFTPRKKLMGKLLQGRIDRDDKIDYDT
jgi:hypothetical protein